MDDDRIGIEPFDRDSVGPASVDLHLSDQFRTFTEFHRALDVTEETNYEEVTEQITVDDTFLLLPGQSVLGITRETISLSNNLCGWLEGRSRFARVGLTIHSTAGFVQPGVKNRQVLEMSNVAPIPLKIHPGTKVCQIIFQETKGEAIYEGRFKDQMEP